MSDMMGGPSRALAEAAQAVLSDRGPIADDAVAGEVAKWLARCYGVACDNEHNARLDGMVFASYGAEVESAIGVARAVNAASSCARRTCRKGGGE